MKDDQIGSVFWGRRLPQRVDSAGLSLTGGGKVRPASRPQVNGRGLLGWAKRWRNIGPKRHKGKGTRVSQ